MQTLNESSCSDFKHLSTWEWWKYWVDLDPSKICEFTIISKWRRKRAEIHKENLPPSLEEIFGLYQENVQTTEIPFFLTSLSLLWRLSHFYLLSLAHTIFSLHFMYAFSLLNRSHHYKIIIYYLLFSMSLFTSHFLVATVSFLCPLWQQNESKHVSIFPYPHSLNIHPFLILSNWTSMLTDAWNCSW